MTLLDARGQPIDKSKYRKSASAIVEPRVGDKFGQWAGRDGVFLSLPGGAILQFDLSRLTLADYRAMRQHYQLGSSLNVLTFIMHGMDWYIDCENKEIATMIEENLREIWTPLIRALSTAFWAGFAPNAVNYEFRDGYNQISSIKDLVPEECRVEWEKVQGWAPNGKVKPTLWKYNGLKQMGFWIPPENTLWYPVLQESGDFYGRKLLKAAFPSWFFSNLMHLFANRYYERFGEPLPIGRGRFEAEVDMGGGKTMSGKAAMEQVVQNLRNRATVVLPSDRDPQTKEYDFDLSYLESQMRGADFERYLSRLDEEMSLAVFTPVLLFRTADVGSYNLGVQHLRIFQQMLNALSGDIQFYLQNYLVDRLKVLNFPGSENIKAKWVFRRQGNADTETFKEVLVELIRQARGMPNLEELGRITGVKLDKIEELTQPSPDPTTTPSGDPTPKPTVKAGRHVLEEAATRVAREVGSGKVQTTLGYRNRFIDALTRDGVAIQDATVFTDKLYTKINGVITQAAPIVDSGEEMKGILEKAFDLEMAG